MKKPSLFNKLVLSSGMVLVLVGIVALSTGAAQKPTTPAAKAPEAKPAAAVAVAPAAKEEKAPTAETKATEPAAETVNVAAAAVEAAKPAAPVGPSEKEVASYLEAYGWMVGQQAGFEMGFSDTEKAAIMKGLEKAAKGEKAPENMKELFPKMQEYLGGKEKAYRAQMMAKMAEEAKVHQAEGEKFLAEVAKEPGVQKTASGLLCKIEKPGTGASPAADDVVTIHYTGKLVNGTVFDSSVERGAPVDLPLYGVIPGFSEGLKLLKEGGKATLYISSELGYGNQAAGPIPAGSTLIFDVELIKIQPKASSPAAEKPEVKAEESESKPSADTVKAITADEKADEAAATEPAKTEAPAVTAQTLSK